MRFTSEAVWITESFVMFQFHTLIPCVCRFMFFICKELKEKEAQTFRQDSNGKEEVQKMSVGKWNLVYHMERLKEEGGLIKFFCLWVA